MFTEHFRKEPVASPVAVWIAAAVLAAPAAAQQRVLGADISYWNCGTSATGISQDNWNVAANTGSRRFVFLRATRGGTTGIDQPQGTPGNPTGSTLSRRYDDPRFVQNLGRATAAGMLVGPYHFARPDIAGNTGTDEADHFMQMAGAWMRPGYLLPVFDLEAGAGGDALAQFALDFSDRIFATLRIRPCIYINGNYSTILQGATAARRDALAKPPADTPSAAAPAYPALWNARYADNANPDAIPVQTGSPKNTYTVYSGYYGPWDDYGAAEPWVFWQYASTVSIPGFNAVDATCDGDVAHGDIEYVRNFLVPAVWSSDRSGDWSTLTNWNSGQAAVPPVTPPDQAAPYATGGLPVPRLPGAAGTGPTSGQYDTVILDRPSAEITVTLTTGTHNIRKLHVREALTLTGGSLTVNYNPAYRADDSAAVLHGGAVSARFSGPVTLSNTASLAAHTVQVDAGRLFALAGGTLTFDTIRLMPHATTPARILVVGAVNLNPRANALAMLARGTGPGGSGGVDLGGGLATLTVGDGTNEVDVSLDVPVTNGALAKAGTGTLRLTAANTYTGGTRIVAGRLLVNNSGGSGTGTGPVTVDGGVLGGTGTIGGALSVNRGGTLAPGPSIATLTCASSVTLDGTSILDVDRNGGVPRADRLLVTAGPLTFGGALVVSNLGAALVGGEVFALFAAPAYRGAFASADLPSLGTGLNWDASRLSQDGTLRVNRWPTAPLLAFTNIAPAVLEVPFAALTANATDADGDLLAVAAVDPTTAGGVTLTTNSLAIRYANHASLADQFRYTLTDGRGGTATGVVRITNIGSTPAARFVANPTWTARTVVLRFTAVPGWTYVLERSTDLAGWRTLWTTVAPAGGAIEFADTFQDLGAPPTAAFYRLRWGP
jgi:autotransporter-associated beta strand protein